MLANQHRLFLNSFFLQKKKSDHQGMQWEMQQVNIPRQNPLEEYKICQWFFFFFYYYYCIRGYLPTFPAVNEAHGMIGSEFYASMKNESVNISTVEKSQYHFSSN